MSELDKKLLLLVQEPWLIGLLTFQALLLGSVIVFRKSWNYNLIVLILAGKLPVCCDSHLLDPTLLDALSNLKC